MNGSNDAREAARRQAEREKRAVAEVACAELPEKGVIGLGSGSTARIFIEAVGELVRAGRHLTGVPTSEASRRKAQALGIPLLADDLAWDIALTVDGADEVDASLHLIKGGGGAHTREKIVNGASRRNVIVVDASKLSNRLGEKWPVPVEVLRFGHAVTARVLSRFGRPVLRCSSDGQPFFTDAGNLIYDLHTGPIDEPRALDADLHAIAGVVETGLFVGRADLVLVGEHDGVRRLELAEQA